jgi:hypothetical protein
VKPGAEETLKELTKERDWYRSAVDRLSRREGKLIQENEQLRAELALAPSRAEG